MNVADFERRAAELLEPGVHGYYAGALGVLEILRDGSVVRPRHRT